MTCWMKAHCLSPIVAISVCLCAPAAQLTLTGVPGENDLTIADGRSATAIYVNPNDDRAVLRAANDLADDLARVAGVRPHLQDSLPAGQNPAVIIGTIGKSAILDQLAAKGKLDTNGITGEWESDVLQIVKNPCPGVGRALVIAGSDRRGTIYGIYRLSELAGVSPWYWWADVPVKEQKILALHGDILKQGPPAVKYRGIFLNDEDWCLRPWAAKTFDPATGNIGPKTYAKVFELLLRLHANFLWPAMHPGTAAFNAFPDDAKLADEYGIIMGSSHCEQMLRNNVSEWDTNVFGEYNFVTNPDGVLKYWEQRLRENGKFENVYTLGMRGIHDSGMPGGGTEREKAARLQTIIADQRDLLGRLVNPEVARVPQIFCPYKEVLGLYRLMPGLPDDITLVWPDDNYGYVRQFSNPRERARGGGAGVYYHVSYYGAPRDYLWLCSTPPALIAEEMTKAYDYGASRVWMLNVGDLKPAELDTEFFLKLAWNPHAWTGTNTYDLFEKPLARDFGPANAPELTRIMAEYYRLNFQRKPEHMGFPTNNLFTLDEAAQRVAAWETLAARVDAIKPNLPPKSDDAFFELIAYPVKAAAAMNEKYLADSPAAAKEIEQLTDFYNHRLAGGKWCDMMSDDPRAQVKLKPGPVAADHTNPTKATTVAMSIATDAATNADFAELNRQVVMQAAHASVFVPGVDARWRTITGLGYDGEAVSIWPTTAAVRTESAQITADSPCLQFKVWLQDAGDWHVTVRALPTFSVDTGKPQRYAVAFDDAPPQMVALPYSLDERNRQWQEDVLRDAALGLSTHTITKSGLHTLKIWMVDPGIVIDTIAAEVGDKQNWGYVWPPETRMLHRVQ